MSGPVQVHRRPPSPWWDGFKLVLLVVGGGIAFMPDELRPHTGRIVWALATTEAGQGLLLAFGAVAAVFGVLYVLGRALLPDDPDHTSGR